jgi:propanol-preferring alcohol dehydrogenase
VSVQTTYWGTRPELVELLDLGGRKLVESRVTKFRLSEATEAYEALQSGAIEGRAVVVPDSSF